MIPSGIKVWIATGHTDMRRGVRSLALTVQASLKRDPNAGDLYVFRDRTGDLVKILWHDESGMLLYAKRTLIEGSSYGFIRRTTRYRSQRRRRPIRWKGMDWRNPQLSCRPRSVG